jgi:octaprenyl-diphosphate synthase
VLNLIRKPIEGELAQYKQLFDETLTHKDPFMHQALSYIKGRSGKMMRPILTLLVAKEYGTITQASLNAAISLELLHTASLVHDDVVDEAGERRGQASVNSTYGNKVAVLLGDYLLSLSLAQAAQTNNIDAVGIISRLGGTLSEGEIFQLENISNEELSEEAYFHIVERKTAALFSTCAQLGAITTGAAVEEVAKAKRLGEIIGVCFQIRDDIFDYFKADIGKPTGNDLREGKFTLPAIYAITHNPSPRLTDLVKRVKQQQATAEEIEEIIAFTKAYGGIEYAEQKMVALCNEALQLLSDFKNAEVREALKQYVAFVADRNL